MVLSAARNTSTFSRTVPKILQGSGLFAPDRGDDGHSRSIDCWVLAVHRRVEPRSGSQQALQALQQNLAGGNLTAAQTAFNTYQSLNQSQSGSAASGSASSASSNSQLSSDLSALGSALSSGNLSSAQQAFATVKSDLKTTLSQAVANAEVAAAQTVQWVDDLFSLSSTDTSPSTPTDPATAILNSAFGLNPSSNATNPTTSLLESEYGDSGSLASGDSTAASGSGPSSSTGVSLYA
ncbi:MAG: hypothetical protein ABR910_06535 [Acidobacteriaceae bacterium]